LSDALARFDQLWGFGYDQLADRHTSQILHSNVNSNADTFTDTYIESHGD
jgi:hypothetical protein